MKTKFHLAFLMLIAACSSCDKPIVAEEVQEISGIKALGQQPVIVALDGYTIKPSDDQIVVSFAEGTTEAQKQAIRSQFPFASPPASCPCGDVNIEQWTIDTDQINIEDAVSRIRSQPGTNSEGDRAFEMTLAIFPMYKPVQPSARPGQLAQPPSTGSINIAVVDTGLDYLRVPVPLYELADTQGCGGIGWNFADNNNNLIDGQGHGTAVTSIIATQLNQSNVDYRILPLKIFNDKGYGTYLNAVCAFAYIREIQRQGGRIDIVNTSFGGKLTDVKAHSVLTGIISDISDKSIIIASAGNDGLNTDNNGNDHFLSSYVSPNILAVGGYKLGNPDGGFIAENIVIHERSNYGKVSIDVTAPFTDESYILYANNAYQPEGTSYATALVTGRAAKITSINRSNPTNLIRSIKQSAVEAPKLQSLIGGKRAILLN